MEKLDNEMKAKVGGCMIWKTFLECAGWNIGWKAVGMIPGCGLLTRVGGAFIGSAIGDMCAEKSYEDVALVAAGVVDGVKLVKDLKNKDKNKEVVKES